MRAPNTLLPTGARRKACLARFEIDGAAARAMCDDDLSQRREVMRVTFGLVVVGSLAMLLGGCVVAEVAGAGVSVATTVVTTTVDVAGSVVSGAAHTVSGKDDDKAKSDDDKDKSGDRDDDDD